MLGSECSLNLISCLVEGVAGRKELWDPFWEIFFFGLFDLAGTHRRELFNAF